MAGRTPIPVSRAMRTIAANLDLARRQQRITLELLAERGIGVDTTPSAPEDADTVRGVLEAESRKYPEFHVECGPLTFWSRAEDYHQRYLDRNPSGYCHIPPWKMESVRSLFDDHF